jgi:hypothetical protein
MFGCNKAKALLKLSLASMLMVSVVAFSTSALAQDEAEMDHDVVKVGVAGGFPEFASVSAAITPMNYQVEIAAGLPILSTDYLNAVGRLGVRPRIWSNGANIELRLPVMLGARYQYNGPDMQPNCVMPPCVGPQENQWFLNAYTGLEASFELSTGFEAFVEAGGGYNILTNGDGADRGRANDIGEARLLIGVIF